jgi:signal transduction histidine kinase
MTERRGVYFAFQGLFMAVLLLIFIYEYGGVEGWLLRMILLTSLLAASMALIRMVPPRAFKGSPFPAGLFIADAALASVVLGWAEPQSNLYLLYFIVVFGTALTRSMAQSFAVACAATALYMASAWAPSRGFSQEPNFWLRVHFLWVSSALSAILSRDTRMQQEEAGRRFAERAVQAERMASLGRLAGEVAHRIKGPLTTILVNAEVLSGRGALAAQDRRLVERIQEEGVNCREILQGLLDLGRIEEIAFARLDLREPVRAAIDAVEPQARGRSIQLLALGLDRPLEVLGDQSLLQEAFSAILQNALEAAPASGGIIRVQAGSAAGPWRLLRRGAPSFEVAISDNGSGIAGEDLERVFEPFFTAKKKGGSGLGLAAAMRVFQKHGGFIWAESEGPGKGAIFTVRIPPAGQR